ncbi:MAG: phosphoglycerate dehydrogenase [Actinobacteria bacterium]|nr:phosphoglycerate dehydrogenase [Actinomycetota bacterium]
MGSVGLEVDMPRFDGQQLGETDLLPIVDRYVGALVGDDMFTRRVLQAASNLRVISKWGVGVDAIDTEAASHLGIKVFNTPGVFGDELADYAMGYLHLLARRQHEVNEQVKRGNWHKVTGRSLAGLTMGIVGLGSSGRALARRAATAGMRVIGYDIMSVDNEATLTQVDLVELFAMSDVISLHIPAAPETRHLIDERALNTMKPGVWLINVSRGSLVDESALLEALVDGRVGAAALDVFEAEPVAPTNPLLLLDNVVVGSHNGSNTIEAVARTTEKALTNLIRGLGLGDRE